MSYLLDEHYLTWLYSQVGSVKVRNPSKSYWSLFKQLYSTEFVWFIPNDDNRVEDGRDLRFEFLSDVGRNDDSDWINLGCSVMELLVALSRRLAFEAGGDSHDWFWVLIGNLGLSDYTDSYILKNSAEEEIEDVVNTMIWRTYDHDGHGGLFPLQDAQRDQRDVELWYQLSAYVLELD